MLHVFLAGFLRAGIGAGVVVALRKSQPALVSFSDHRGCVFEILVGAKAEKRIGIDQVQVRQKVGKIVPGLESSNAVQLRLQRSDAFALNGSFIHAGGIKIANLLLFRTAVGAAYGSFIENAPQDKTIALRQFSIAAIVGLVARNRVLLEPSTAGILVEVHAGIGVLVYQRRVKPFQLQHFLSPGFPARLRGLLVRRHDLRLLLLLAGLVRVLGIALRKKDAGKYKQC